MKEIYIGKEEGENGCYFVKEKFSGYEDWFSKTYIESETGLLRFLDKIKFGCEVLAFNSLTGRIEDRVDSVLCGNPEISFGHSSR